MSKQYDELVTKLVEARDELFDYERMVETMMINGPEYVVDEMVAEIKKLRKALEYYADETHYVPYVIVDVNPCDITEDGGYIAREALGIGEESNAL